MTKKNNPLEKMICIEIWEHESGTRIVNSGEEDVTFCHIIEGERTPKDVLFVGARRQVSLERKFEKDLFIRIK